MYYSICTIGKLIEFIYKFIMPTNNFCNPPPSRILNIINSAK